MEAAEYYRLARVENDHWWYRAMHELVASVVKKRSKGSTFAPRGLNLNILDAGCGTGGLTEKLERFGEVVGLDISPLALKLAGDKGLRLIRGSVNSLPFPADSFDLAVSISVLYHQNINDQQAVSELTRVLKPGGKIVIILPAFEWLYSAHDRAVHTERRYTLGQGKKLLENDGLKITEARYLYGFMFPIFLIKRLIERIFPPANNISDLAMPPKLINDLLFWICRVEWRLRKIFRLPFGSSLLLVGEKR